MDLRETYNLIAEDWHRDHAFDDWWGNGLETFTSLLPPDARVLDAGCAGGVKTRLLVERGFKATGIDFSEKFIEIARRNVPEAEFHVRDIRDASALGPFDGILLVAVLLHIPKRETVELLRRLSDALAPGGVICASVKRRREGQPEEEVKQEDDYGFPYERFFSYFSEGELAGFFREAGFGIVHEETVAAGSTSWNVLIARKPF